MQTMVAAGADRIWAQDSGGTGPALVLLHSGVADARLWDPVWPQLAAAFRVIRYDSRGYGRSPAATEPYTELGDLRAVLGHFGLGQVALAGCSQGAGTAAELALAEPGRSAERKNFAQRLYQAEGYRVVDGPGRDSDTMVADL